MIDDIKYKLNFNNSEKPSGNPQASVLIAILNYGKFIESPELIYTQRSGNLSTHSGEVSFPGGKAEKTDKNLYETALRESNEEMSLKSKDVTKLGKLNYLISRHKIEVNPFVAITQIQIQQEYERALHNIRMLSALTGALPCTRLSCNDALEMPLAECLVHILPML